MFIILFAALILTALMFTACGPTDAAVEDAEDIDDSTAEGAVDAVLADELADADDSVEIGEMI